jgi:hypothetical protein
MQPSCHRVSCKSISIEYDEDHMGIGKQSCGLMIRRPLMSCHKRVAWLPGTTFVVRVYSSSSDSTCDEHNPGLCMAAA